MADYTKLFDLTGKKAIVIGGAGGIGKAIASGLAQFGADTAIASRNEEKLKEAAEEIEKETGKKIRYYTVDVSSEESIQELVAKTKADVGITDILVNSQGLNHKFLAEEMPMDEWHRARDGARRSPSRQGAEGPAREVFRLIDTICCGEGRRASAPCPA